jgi:hypothetical protein
MAGAPPAARTDSHAFEIGAFLTGAIRVGAYSLVCECLQLEMGIGSECKLR